MRKISTKEIPEGAHVTRTKQWHTCGKSTCGCHKDKDRRHGPYLYLYWRENGVLQSKYGGRWVALDLKQRSNTMETGGGDD